MKNRLEEMAGHYHVEEVYAFGSRAKEVAARVRNEETGVAHPESDLDIGVRIKAGVALGPSERVKLALEIEDLLGFHASIW